MLPWTMLLISGIIGWILLLAACIIQKWRRQLLFATILVLAVHLGWSYVLFFLNILELLPVVKWIVPHLVFAVLVGMLIFYDRLSKNMRNYLLWFSFGIITLQLLIVHIFFHKGH